MTRFIFAFVVTAVLTGCKDPQPNPRPALALVTAGRDVLLRDVRVYPPNDSVAGTNDEYYIVRFEFTNHLGFALAPRIDHFVLQDEQNRRFLGADSGNANLIGISNYDGTLKVGDSHEYTVGFRVPQSTHGLLFYDATF